MIKIFLAIFILIFSCDKDEKQSCEDLGYEVDFCGICGGTCEEDNPQSCDEVDDCGDCYGGLDGIANSSCTGCKIENETTYELGTYNSSAIFQCENILECCFYGIFEPIDLKFLTDDFCVTNNLIDDCSGYTTESSCNNYSGDKDCKWNATYYTYETMPIQFINSSSIDINIYTIDTEPSYCDISAGSPPPSQCSLLENQYACENANCRWLESTSFNSEWDEFEETIPAMTNANNNQFYVTSFLSETTETYCAMINNIEKCGKIVVLYPN